MIVKADIPARDVWNLVAVAERRGHTTVGQLLAELADDLLNADPIAIEYRARPTMVGRQRPTFDQEAMRIRVRDLHARRFNDIEMANELGCSAETIRVRRNELGLTPNRQSRKANA